MFSIYFDEVVDSIVPLADEAPFPTLQFATADFQVWRLRPMHYLRNLLEATQPISDNLAATVIQLLALAMYCDRGTISEGLDKDLDSPDQYANA